MRVLVVLLGYPFLLPAVRKPFCEPISLCLRTAPPNGASAGAPATEWKVARGVGEEGEDPTRDAEEGPERHVHERRVRPERRVDTLVVRVSE